MLGQVPSGDRLSESMKTAVVAGGVTFLQQTNIFSKAIVEEGWRWVL